MVQKATYLEALHYDCILVVQCGGKVLSFYRTNILLNVASNDHDLPLGSILGDASESAAPMASRLHLIRLNFRGQELLLAFKA